MTEAALFQIICELAKNNVELKQTQDYLLQAVESLHKRTAALESLVHVLAKAHLERIVEQQQVNYPHLIPRWGLGGIIPELND